MEAWAPDQQVGGALGQAVAVAAAPKGSGPATLLAHNDGRDYGSEPNRLPVVVKQAQAAIFQEAFRRATSACAAARGVRLFHRCRQGA